MRYKVEKLLVLGGRPTGYLDEWDITSNLKLAEWKLDLHVEELASRDVLERLEALPEEQRSAARQTAEKLVKGAEKSPGGAPARSVVEDAAAFYVVARGLLDEGRADGLTVNCSGWKSEVGRPLPCVALTLLQENGYLAVCQGDMDALFTGVLFHRVGARPTYVGGALAADGGLFDVSHCVLPRNMTGLDSPPRAWYLADYHGGGEGCTVHTTVPAGTRITLGRLTRGLETLLLTTGAVEDCADRTDRCRNTLYVRTECDILAPLKGHQQHLVVAAGDHRDGLGAAARDCGIAVERFS